MTSTPDTRTLIMDAFGEQLGGAGYAGISLVGVARAAGIQKPSIYHHFPAGKDELYAAVALRFIEQSQARVAEALTVEGSTQKKLEALALISSEHSTNTISFEQRIYDALDLVSAETKTLVSQRYVAGLLDPVVDLFTQSAAAGEVQGDPWFLMNAFLHLARATDASAPDGASRIVAVFLDGARLR